MSLSHRLRPLMLAFGVGLWIAVAGSPAGAVEAPPGSKNFTPPADVPNYFSNESGPFQGDAVARNTYSGAVPMVAARVSHGRRAVASRRYAHHRHPAHLAAARGHSPVAHGRPGTHRQVAHAGAPRHGHASGPKMAHAPGRHLAGKTVAAKSRAASGKGKHPARAHG